VLPVSLSLVCLMLVCRKLVRLILVRLIFVRLMLVCSMLVRLRFVRLLLGRRLLFGRSIFVRLYFGHLYLGRFVQKGSYHPTIPPKATVCARIGVVFLKRCYKMFVETFCVPCGVVLFVSCEICVRKPVKDRCVDAF
jgi:hypothetical protein